MANFKSIQFGEKGEELVVTAPLATNEIPGTIKPDGKTTAVAKDGTLSTLPQASAKLIYQGEPTPGPDDEYIDVNPEAKPWPGYKEVVDGSLSIDIPEISKDTLILLLTLEFTTENPLTVDSIPITKTFMLTKSLEADAPGAAIQPQQISGLYSTDIITMYATIAYHNTENLESNTGLLSIAAAVTNPEQPEKEKKLYIKVASIISIN